MIHAWATRLWSLIFLDSVSIDSGRGVELVEKLGWTLLHSLWQFTLIGCLLAIVLKTLLRRSAQLGYVACAVALMALTVAAPLTFWFVDSATRTPGPIASSEKVIPRIEPQIRPAVSKNQAAINLLPPDPATAGDTEGWIATTRSAHELVAMAIVSLLRRGASTEATPARTYAAVGWGRGEIAGLRDRLAPWLNTLVACWACGVLLFSCRLSLGWLALRRLRNRGIAEVSTELRDLASDVAGKLGIKRVVRVVHSQWVEIPATFGWLAPVVLLPISLTAGVTPQELQAILAHELAHVRRHDFLVNLLQMVAETLFFYHPGVWWVSNRMRQLREDCCDDLAVQIQGDRAAYARALLRVDELRIAAPRPALLFSGGVLLARIRRVLGVKNDAALSPAWAVPPMLLLGLLALSAWFALAAGRGEQVSAQETAPAVAADTTPMLMFLDAKNNPIPVEVQLGQVGYGTGLKNLNNWSAQKNREVWLTGLNEGTHTLVAKTISPFATLFTFKVPAAERRTLQTIRPFPAWYNPSKTDFPEMQVSVEEKESPLAWILVELTNSSDMPLSISDADLALVLRGKRVYLPQWAIVGGNEIPAHSTRVIRISWAEVVKRGIWTSRNEVITEPWPFKNVDKDHVYVRVDLGSHSSKHLSLPTPERVLAYVAKPTESQPSLATGRTRYRRLLPGRPLFGPHPDDLKIDWINAEHGTQYRMWTPDHPANAEGVRVIAPEEIPLVYVEIRNVGSGVQLDLCLNATQIRQRLKVDGVDYEWGGNTMWGGVAPLPVGGEPVRLAFLLSHDWIHKAGQQRTPLTLTEGPHRVSVQLELHEFQFIMHQGERLRAVSPRSRRIATRPITFQLDVAKRRDKREILLGNLRRELDAFPRSHAAQISASLQGLLEQSRSDAVDFLITQIGEGADDIPDPASFILAKLWDDMDHQQRDRYIKASMTHFVHQRARYPAGVPAGIGVGVHFRSGYNGLPRDKSRPHGSDMPDFEIITKHFLDEKEVGPKPTRLAMYASYATHFYRTDDLVPGRHTFRLVTDYTCKFRGEKFEGHLESPVYSFTTLPPNAPNPLLAPPSAQLDQQVRKAFKIMEVMSPHDRANSYFGIARDRPVTDAILWRPQQGRASNDPTGPALHSPDYHLSEPLPVDLCYKVQFLLEGTKTALPAGEITILAGDTFMFYFSLSNYADRKILEKHADKDGFVPLRVKLTPSLAVALSSPEVQSYYGGEITSDVVRARLIYDAPRNNTKPAATPVPQNPPGKSPAPPPAKPEEKKTGTTKSEPRRSLFGRVLFVGERPAPQQVTSTPPNMEGWKRDGYGDSPHRPSFPGIHFHEYYRNTMIFKEEVVVGPQFGLANVFVWLRPTDRMGRMPVPAKPDQPAPAILSIREGRFSPHALIVPAWQKLEIKNFDRGATDVTNDNMSINPFSQMLRGETGSVTWSPKAEKLPIKIRSNFGSWMSSYVLRLEHPYAAVTGEDGTFRIDDPPAGKWELVFWHEKIGFLSSDKYPQGKEPIEFSDKQLDLGEIRVAAKTLIPEKKPDPHAPNNKSDVGWIDGQHGLQYRFRRPDQAAAATGVWTIARGELPLIYLDVRNVGKEEKLHLGIEPNQVRQTVIVNNQRYTRADLTWGGVKSLDVGDEPVSIPFVLSSDWKTSSDKGPRQLDLDGGLNLIAFELQLREYKYEETATGTRRTEIETPYSRQLVTQPLQLRVHADQKIEPRDLVMTNLRRELEAYYGFHAPKVTANIDRLIREGRPDSINLLLSRIRDAKENVPDPASFLLTNFWDDLDRKQIEQFFKAQMTHSVRQRDSYPAGVDAAIGVGPNFRAGSYKGLPDKPDIQSETVTNHFLDGKPIGEPFRYASHSGISYWFPTKDLSVGRHTFRMTTDYTFKWPGNTYSGRVESPEYSFTITPTDTPDTLLAPPSPQLDNLVRNVLRIRETIPHDPNGLSGRNFKSMKEVEAARWKPQIRITSSRSAMKTKTLHMPVWQLREPLPVDLCFRVELQLEGTKSVIPCTDLVIHAGNIRPDHIAFSELNYKDLDLFAELADKRGFVPLRVKLTPSRGTALSSPQVKKYYGGEILSDVVRARVNFDPDKKAPVLKTNPAPAGAAADLKTAP